MSLKRRVMGLAAAGVAALGMSLATAPAHAQTVQPNYSCPYTAICVHMHHNGQSDWTWKDYYYCGDFYLGSWVPTYYVNNQTPGTKAKFKDINKTPIQTTPGAYSSGSVTSPYSTFYVRPC